MARFPIVLNPVIDYPLSIHGIRPARRAKYGYDQNGRFVNRLTGEEATEAEHLEADRAYYAMMRIERKFQQELLRKHGQNWQEMRVHPERLTGKIRKLATEYQTAWDEWMENWTVQAEQKEEKG